MSEPLYGEDLAFVQHVGFAKSARGTARTILTRLAGAGIESGRVADLGCGDGGLLAALSAAGYEAWGVDASPHLVERARESVPGATIVSGALPDGVQLPKIRAATAVGEVLTYLEDGTAVERLIRSVYDALDPGGVFLFDFIASDPSAPMNYQSWRDDPDWAMGAEVTENVADGWLERRIVTFRRMEGELHYRRREESHRVRVYPQSVVEGMLETVGFEVTRVASLGPALPRRVALQATRPRSATPAGGTP